MCSGDNGRRDLESAADGLRRLTDLLLRVTDDDGGPTAVADELDTIARMLDEQTDDETSGVRDPVSGKGNAIAPPIDMDIDDSGNVSATGLLGLPYQGPKTLVHGGMSALLLSHVLGAAGTVAGEHAVVQELSVRYHRPTPLFTPLEISASLTDPAGDHARGSIEVDGVTTVSAEARLALPPQQ
ncbi:hotdog domain-containing protein [Nocardia sp. 348MFTsu5.1]|uniref:hotdog domain-containing protein n=1 Tax=Nocardia sp. 348MFTsu5.1 TaxID=1172185 RepID=UPI00035E73FA|nr:hotdog domain-containing protein [Nocardia sp. 348MFTsu5.1]